jgi:hypothetical protein
MDSITEARLVDHNTSPQVDAARGIEPASLPVLAPADALIQLRKWCIPGMNWTDEVGQLLLALADASIVAARKPKPTRWQRFKAWWLECWA